MGPRFANADLSWALSGSRTRHWMSGGGITHARTGAVPAPPKLPLKVYWQLVPPRSVKVFITLTSSGPLQLSRTVAELPKHVMISPASICSIAITPVAVSCNPSPRTARAFSAFLDCAPSACSPCSIGSEFSHWQPPGQRICSMLRSWHSSTVSAAEFTRFLARPLLLAAAAFDRSPKQESPVVRC